MTWAIRLSPELAKGVIGVAKAFGFSILLLDQPPIPDLADRFRSPPSRIGAHMKRVTGIGGIFFKAKDAPALQAWYKRHLGIDVQVWGGASFDWTDAEGKPVAGTTAWLITPQESKQFAPSSAAFMVNYRVEDVHALVKALKEEGCNVLEKIDDSEYGKFAWVIDPEGNKVELWQPPQGG
jgi:predicted enzyme related to lactoylglutathione lyase